MFHDTPLRSAMFILQMKKPRFLEVWGQVPKVTEVHLPCWSSYVTWVADLCGVPWLLGSE